MLLRTLQAIELITILKCHNLFPFSSAAVKVLHNGHVVVMIINLGYFVLRVKGVSLSDT